MPSYRSTYFMDESPGAQLFTSGDRARINITKIKKISIAICSRAKLWFYDKGNDPHGKN